METRIKKRGSRQEVFEGKAMMTSGNLSKEDLIFNERTGKIITAKEKERGMRLKEVMNSRKAASPEPLPSPLDELAEFRRTTTGIPPEQKAAPRKSRTQKSKSKKKSNTLAGIPEPGFDADQE